MKLPCHRSVPTYETVAVLYPFGDSEEADRSTDPSALSDLRELASNALNNDGASEGVNDTFVRCLHEALANAVEHGGLQRAVIGRHPKQRTFVQWLLRQKIDATVFVGIVENAEPAKIRTPSQKFTKVSGGNGLNGDDYDNECIEGLRERGMGLSVIGSLAMRAGVAGSDVPVVWFEVADETAYAAAA